MQEVGFNFEDESAPVDVAETEGESAQGSGNTVILGPAVSETFVLVPHGVFVSWPERKQLAYCAARDRASMHDELDAATFYAERAASYEEAMR